MLLKILLIFVSEEDADFVDDEMVKWKTALHNLASSNAKICKCRSEGPPSITA